MKNILILGANGASAREIIPRLLEQDDVRLTLFVRRAARVQSFKSDRVDVFEGDATRLADLRKAMQGQDIVVSTMGGMDLGDKTAGVVKVMEECGVRRIIAISAGGIYGELPEPFNSWDLGMIGQNTRCAMLETAQIIEDSSLDYTVLRPVWLTNKPSTDFELTKKGETFKGTETSRASIGQFVADAVKNPQLYINESLGISQPDTDGDRPAAYR
jgi:nucleoside-diphosphate-sugar epimerase